MDALRHSFSQNFLLSENHCIASYLRNDCGSTPYCMQPDNPVSLIGGAILLSTCRTIIAAIDANPVSLAYLFKNEKF